MSTEKINPTHILVVDSGWVFAGTVTGLVLFGDDHVCLDDAVVIRRWGTERGLGQLALSGPTTETRLDPVPRVVIPRIKLLFSIPVMAGDWRVQ